MASETPDVTSTAPGYRLVERDGYVHVALRGRPRLKMVLSMFGELEKLTTNDAELLVLIDESEMKAALLSPGELRAMIDGLKASPGLSRSRIAIYAPSPLVYGLNRMAQAFAGERWEHRLKAFRSEDEAERWLLGENE